MMRKIIVIGSPGAGKSTFARKLRDKTGLPLHYLDAIWRRSDKTNITRDEFDSKLADILKTDEWIVDGNYGRTLEMRLKACDTVFCWIVRRMYACAEPGSVYDRNVMKCRGLRKTWMKSSDNELRIFQVHNCRRFISY